MEKEKEVEKPCRYRVNMGSIDFCDVKLANNRCSPGSYCNFKNPENCKIATSTYCKNREGNECIALREGGYEKTCRHPDNIHECLIYQGILLRNLEHADVMSEAEGKEKRESLISRFRIPPLKKRS